MSTNTEKKTNQTCTQKYQSRDKNNASGSNAKPQGGFSVKDEALDRKNRVVEYVQNGAITPTPTPSQAPTNAATADLYLALAKMKESIADLEEKLRPWSSGNATPSNLANPAEISSDYAISNAPDASSDGVDPEDQCAEKPQARSPYKKQSKVQNIEEAILQQFRRFLNEEDKVDLMPSADVLDMVVGWMNKAVGLTSSTGGYTPRQARRYLDRMFKGWHLGRPKADR